MSMTDLEAFDTTVTIEPRRGRGRPRIKDDRFFNELSHAEKVQRWERVRKVLRDMSKHQIKHHFDMGQWIRETECGTVGCAAGLCSIDPWFNRRGFASKLEFGAHSGWTIHPCDFFGPIGYDDVFTDENIIRDKDGESRTPTAQHRLALRAVNQYLKGIKS